MPFFLSLLAAAAPATAAERRFTVTEFDRVQVDGPFQVVLTTGKAASATASGSVQAIDRVSIEVQGRTLRVKPNRAAWGGYPNEGAGPVRILLSTHELRSVSVTGPARLEIDKAKAMWFDVALSGSGRISLPRVEADNLVVGLLGSGQIALGGSAKILRATVQGSGDLDAASLVADDARIDTETSGNVHVGAKRSAKITAAGSGDTIVEGTPACTIKAIGSGRVSCGSDQRQRR